MCFRVPPGVPGCPWLEVGRVPRVVVDPPRAPRGRGEGSYEGRKSFEEKMCDEKNEKMQKLGSGEVPQGCRYIKSCALVWGKFCQLLRSWGPRLGVVIGVQPGAPGGQILGPSPENKKTSWYN